MTPSVSVRLACDGHDHPGDPVRPAETPALRGQTARLLKSMSLLVLDLSAERSVRPDDLASEIACRLQLAALTADMLFEPRDLRTGIGDALRDICGNVVRTFALPTRRIHLAFEISARCPTHLRQSVLHAAYELVGDAVRDAAAVPSGRRPARPSARISVRLRRWGDHLLLSVHHEGAGAGVRPAAACRSSPTLRALAEHGGARIIPGADRDPGCTLVFPLHDRPTGAVPIMTGGPDRFEPARMPDPSDSRRLS